MARSKQMIRKISKIRNYFHKVNSNRVILHQIPINIDQYAN